MADMFSREKRSSIMAQNKSKNTSIETMVFRHLRCQGIYFQKHYSKIKGSPDLAVPSKKRAVFIDGDFWHGKDFARLEYKLPPFWREKIRDNMERDQRNRKALQGAGWHVLEVWEWDLRKNKEATLGRIARFLRPVPPTT
jgi:DNA mismatch endonuclease, patch repair protein